MAYEQAEYKHLGITFSNKSSTGSFVIAGSCPDPIVRSCKFCSEKIEWIGRKPFNYREGSAHRCLGGRQQ